MKQINQKVVVGGVIVNENKVLIVQRASDEEAYPDLWELPSGKKEPLEKVTDAIIREVKEETGLTTEIIKMVDVFNFSVEKPDETRDVTQINFLLKLIGSSEVKLSEEHQNFAWITKDEINNYNLSEETKSAIIKSFI
ncbi:MAG: Mutator MutT related protein [Candidatus Woesebacteria bacterium GW2011_GWA1_33_30]|uniref:Mutator MutT related protein n=1 Tax=Candidatus Woesebacteria bacterium GW2011_GWA2_33_28 TaxID=1618561 RepID=A0A0G0A508_9BACT|nr:MAG: Mutator MutT related protein [Candidatus Woesebacteria bacterium GW2011_GWA2_33_28]KKP46811.1 MAG: Mutator MutT related protein [Candidatus Woesebacteria bacterium GW2011_GWA1_33_30]KKP48455.1 MAG: Mutator MutT related protein [Microgenomates group bacterium GW2011_GWC1_33_32]KKP51302.1 MAG: Mutator MutT related protein [Candidatus Woesebacteria bacterium GW2011_GWB1_33_38]KKP55812.1 MAG: Mutator MutT related protein [Microgenomates group bacterium GW2011_GWD1_33_9]